MEAKEDRKFSRQFIQRLMRETNGGSDTIKMRF